MRVGLQALRTALFYLLYVGQTVVLALLLGTYVLFVRRRSAFTWAVASYWYRSNVALLRWIGGIRTVVDGAENIPDGPLIFASKHQSNWDVFAILPFCDDKPAFIAKRELMDIPFFGWAARSVDTISIDRKLGAGAIPSMLSNARAALSRGCRIIIFPEGTRKIPLAPPAYRQGIVRMYEALGVPVVPVALNSGLFWGRNSLLWPGPARARFLPAIAPGLDANEFAARLEAAIETELRVLIAGAVSAGDGRPVDGAFREKLADQANGPPSA